MFSVSFSLLPSLLDFYCFSACLKEVHVTIPLKLCSDSDKLAPRTLKIAYEVECQFGCLNFIVLSQYFWCTYNQAPIRRLNVLMWLTHFRSNTTLEHSTFFRNSAHVSIFPPVVVLKFSFRLFQSSDDSSWKFSWTCELLPVFTLFSRCLVSCFFCHQHSSFSMFIGCRPAVFSLPPIYLMHANLHSRGVVRIVRKAMAAYARPREQKSTLFSLSCLFPDVLFLRALRAPSNPLLSHMLCCIFASTPTRSSHFEWCRCAIIEFRGRRREIEQHSMDERSGY